MKRILIFALLALALAFPALAARFGGAPSGGSAPSVSVVPVVSPTTPTVGTALNTTNGTWTGSPTSYAYTWWWADTSAVISGATASSYTTVSGDVGHTIELQVAASNAYGASIPATSNLTSAVTSSANVAYTLPTGDVLHYIAATGASDSYDGTAPTHTTGSIGPWASPHHAMNCGDVIIVAAGTYTTQFGGTGPGWGAVSNCPSTSGGIDGTGGVYFAVVLCAGPDLESCKVGAGTGVTSFDIGKSSSWAVEGFKATSPSGGPGVSPAFLADSGLNTSGCSGVYHHFAFINNIAYSSAAGFGTNDCGTGGGTTTPGIDYWAAVGDIAQASNTGLPGSGYCVAAIDFVGMANSDANAGTHGLMYGNYSYNGIATGCVALYDGEDYMFDSDEVHLGTGTFIANSNIGFYSSRACIQVTSQPPHAGSQNMYVSIYNNTCFADNQLGSTNPGGNVGELNLSGPNGSVPFYSLVAYNNVMPNYTNGTYFNSSLYSAVVGGTQWGSWKEGTELAAGLENVFYSVNTSCHGTTCAPSASPYAEAYFNSNPTASDTTNIFRTDPAYADTSDLLANRTRHAGLHRVRQRRAMHGLGRRHKDAHDPVRPELPDRSPASRGLMRHSRRARNADHLRFDGDGQRNDQRRGGERFPVPGHDLRRPDGDYRFDFRNDANGHGPERQPDRHRHIFSRGEPGDGRDSARKRDGRNRRLHCQ